MRVDETHFKNCTLYVFKKRLVRFESIQEYLPCLWKQNIICQGISANYLPSFGQGSLTRNISAREILQQFNQ